MEAGLMDERRVALVTGANKGIGFETARGLGRQGVTVLVGARDARLGADAVARLAAEGIGARVVAIDVASQASVDAAVADVRAVEGRLDILVNNAGIGFGRHLPSEASVDLMREVLETNLLGAIRAAQGFLPMLRESPAGRIVNVSSTMGSVSLLADPQWPGYRMFTTPYSISKAALNAFTALLSAELAGTGIKVNSIEPGYTETDLTGGQGFQTAEVAARIVVDHAMAGADGASGGYFDVNGPIAW